MTKLRASPTLEPVAAPPPRNREERRDQLRRGLEALLQQAGSGSRLPPERELAEHLGVARETLRRALDELQSRGLLERRQGAGTFVTGQSWLKPLLLRSFTEDMRERGLVASSELLSHTVRRADAKVALRLKAVPGSEVFEVHRLRLASGEPMAIEHTYLPCARLPGLDPSRLVSASLYELLHREYGLVVRNAAQEIQATVLSEDEARLLDVAPFSPALLVERLVYATDGEPVEYGKSLYRADRYRFEVNVGRALPPPEGEGNAEGSGVSP
jgi:GntR family transcriptional regulator